MQEQAVRGGTSDLAMRYGLPLSLQTTTMPVTPSFAKAAPVTPPQQCPFFTAAKMPPLSLMGGITIKLEHPTLL